MSKMKIVLPPAGTYVVAVSGGVDSIVVLDALVAAGGYRIIVAHFDHGIRSDSASDALFVRDVAARYGLDYQTQREVLGPTASEALARNRRYRFLRRVAQSYQATLITAHHADDIIETVTINLIRGTGWRGLAVLDSDIVRPLLGVYKNEIIAYATDRQLLWREDSTNASEAYLRNRIRQKLARLGDDSLRQLLALHATQVSIKAAIDHESNAIIQGRATQPRYPFALIDDVSADELLRAMCVTVSGMSPTRPQRRRALLAIKTGKAGSQHHISKALYVDVTLRTFTIVATESDVRAGGTMIGRGASA